MPSVLLRDSDRLRRIFIQRLSSCTRTGRGSIWIVVAAGSLGSPRTVNHELPANSAPRPSAAVPGTGDWARNVANTSLFMRQ